MVRVWKVFCTSAATQGESPPQAQRPCVPRVGAGGGAQGAGGLLVVVVELVDVVEVVTVVLGVGWQEPTCFGKVSMLLNHDFVY